MKILEIIRKGQESNLPKPGSPTSYDFEDREGHQTPSASEKSIMM